MADEKKGFLLRLSPRMFEEVRRWAEQDLRSINGQIEFLLREALRKAGRKVKAPADGDAPAEPAAEPSKRRRAADE